MEWVKRYEVSAGTVASDCLLPSVDSTENRLSESRRRSDFSVTG